MSKDCVYVTVIDYMYFYNGCEIHFFLTMADSLFNPLKTFIECVVQNTTVHLKLLVQI